jgi:hypothetical protein
MSEYQTAPNGDRKELAARLATELGAGRPSPMVTVRTFLHWFGAYRRGYLIVTEIRDALQKAGLRTEPDFESEYIDAEIRFVVLKNGKTSTTKKPVDVTEAVIGDEQA